MKFKFDINDSTTWGGFIMLFFGIVATVSYLMGKDPAPIMTIGATIYGSFHVVTTNNSN